MASFFAMPSRSREIGPWIYAGVATNLSPTTMYFKTQGDSDFRTYYVDQACVLRRIKMMLGNGSSSGTTDSTITAGTITCAVYKNQSATGMSTATVTCALGNFYNFTAFAGISLAAGDRLDIRVSTSADLAPSGSIDVAAWLEVE